MMPYSKININDNFGDPLKKSGNNIYTVKEKCDVYIKLEVNNQNWNIPSKIMWVKHTNKIFNIKL